MNGGAALIRQILDAQRKFADEDLRRANVATSRIDSALPQLEEAFKILAEREINDVAHRLLDIKSTLQGVSEPGEAS